MLRLPFLSLAAGFCAFSVATILTLRAVTFWPDLRIGVLHVGWPGSQMCSPGNRGLVPQLLFDAYESRQPLSKDAITAKAAAIGTSLDVGLNHAQNIPALASGNAIVFLGDASSCDSVGPKTVSLAARLKANGYDVAYAVRPDVDGVGWYLHELTADVAGKDVLFYLRASRLVLSGEIYFVTADIWRLHKNGYDNAYVKDNSYTADFIVDTLKASHPRSITLIVETSGDEEAIL